MILIIHIKEFSLHISVNLDSNLDARGFVNNSIYIEVSFLLENFIESIQDIIFEREYINLVYGIGISRLSVTTVLT